MRSSLAVAAVLIATLPPCSGHAQSSTLTFRQDRDGAPLVKLTQSELAELGDPLFNLVLKNKANLVDLTAVMDAIQNASGRALFVVDEKIVSSAKAGARRSVTTFSGTRDGETLDGNVMVSSFFGPAGFAAVSDIEAWGWDNHRQRYNFYKLDSSTPEGNVWKFRSSSVGAELKSVAERKGTCLACHVSGAPIMKELFFPWNNWHAGVGGSFKAEYLDPNGFLPAAEKWGAAGTDAFKRLTGANTIEDDILIPAFKRFSQSRLNTALKRDNATGNRSVTPAGKMTVIEARRLLRPIFETIDVNFYSSRDTSGIHPFGLSTDFVPGKAIHLPVDQFFLNTSLIAGDGEGGLGGLKLTSARGFESFASLTQQENRDLVTSKRVLLNGVPGDTQFAWFVPGASFGDNALIDECLRQGIVTPHFLAAALAVDLENPVFSERRAALREFLPEQFDFTPAAAGVSPATLPRNAATDLLTAAVLANINAVTPAVAADSAAGEFRTLLSSPDAVKELDRRVADYVARVKARLDAAPANGAARKQELERLFDIAIRRRQAVEQHAVLRSLDETGGGLLLPLPP